MTLAALLAAACAQLAIRGPAAVPEHRAVRLEASAPASPDAIVLWDVQPQGRAPLGDHADDADHVDIVREDPAALWFVAPPGRYAVRLVVKEPRAPQRSARFTVAVVPRAPPPEPTPPPPTPETSAVVTVIDDAATRGPALGALFISQTWRRELAAAGHRWFWLDIKDDVVVRQRLDRAVRAAGGAPALVVQAPDGRVLAARRCPEDDAALLAAVRAALSAPAPRPLPGEASP